MWTVHNLNNDLKRLKSLYRKETDLKKKYDLSIYIEALETTVTNFTQDNKAELINEGLFFNAQELPKYRIYIPYIKEFLRIIDPVANGWKEKIYNSTEYKDKEMYMLTDKFFKSIDDKTYEIYKNIDKDKAQHLNFTQLKAIDSITYVVPPLNKYYINLGSNDNDEEIIEAYIHEIGHIIASRKNNKRYHTRETFTEIESIFFEILADRFLFNETGNDYFSYLEKDKVNKNYAMATIMDISSRSYDKVANNLLDIDNPDLEFEKELKKNGLLYICNRDYETTMRYLFSYMCAIELAMIYKENKEEALHILDNIISYRPDISEYEKIVTNIEPNKYVKKYVKELKKVKE